MLNRMMNKFYQYMIRRAAQAHGFMDPIALIARLNRFAKPAEVAVPIEVMRIGLVLQARGIVNSQAIQHNLDWIWPFWVSRQFDPRCRSFIPRAFSMTHINLTHRNWTAVGLPGRMELPIIDPRGLVTPLYDQWSVDAWIVQEDGQDLIPSRMEDAFQEWDIEKNLKVVTRTSTGNYDLLNTAEFCESEDGTGICRINLKARSQKNANLVISVRPYNPEGVSFINEIKQFKDRPGWVVNNESFVHLNKEPQRYCFSNYGQGDVYRKIFKDASDNKVECDVGLATAAAVFPIAAGEEQDVIVDIPLDGVDRRRTYRIKKDADKQWETALQEQTQLKIADKEFQFLYDAAVRTLLLHTGEDIFPGPYTYKHFWFRDAAFMFYALLCSGITAPCKNAIDLFFKRQKINGYFCSQEGEWDSNGQVLWALGKYYEMTGHKPDPKIKSKIKNAVDWITRKRTSSSKKSPHAGLLPAGFSAEHFGPNDFYYWDDFWGVAGFEAGDFLMKEFGDEAQAQRYAVQAEDMMASIEKSLQHPQDELGVMAMPSSPYRRLDSSAIGSVAVGYPLNLWDADDPRLLKTVEYLLEYCFINNGFFHDMSHSGINPYLTLYVAQVLMRANDPRYIDLMRSIADLATETGQWPEAVHPLTRGGCMGDGQHAWAAAEWVIMMRNCFVREEKAADEIVLCQGVASEWYEDSEASFEQALTSYGKINVAVKRDQGEVIVSWQAQWNNDKRPKIRICLPGFKQEVAEIEEGQVLMTPE